MEISEQAEVGTWLKEIKDATDFLNKKLAEMPEHSDLEIDVSVNQVARPKTKSPGKSSSTLQDVRCLADEKEIWQVTVAVKQIKKASLARETAHRQLCAAAKWFKVGWSTLYGGENADTKIPDTGIKCYEGQSLQGKTL